MTRASVFLHLTGLAFWVGALVPLLALLRARDPKTLAVMDRFSPCNRAGRHRLNYPRQCASNHSARLDRTAMEDSLRRLAARRAEKPCRAIVTVAADRIEICLSRAKVGAALEARLLEALKTFRAWCIMERLWAGQLHHYAFSISESQIDKVAAHTEVEEAHHSRVSFQDEFRTCFEKIRDQ